MNKDWQQKYLDLRAKFLEATDLAYREGFTSGLKEAKMQQMMQQQQEMQQQMMQQQQMMAGGGDPSQGGMPPEGMEGGEEGQMPEGMEGGEGEQAPEGMDEQQGGELDQHINELENLVSKGEKPKVTDIRKVVDSLVGLRKAQKIKINDQARAIPAQRRIIKSVLKSWEEETKSDYGSLEQLIEQYSDKENK